MPLYYVMMCHGEPGTTAHLSTVETIRAAAQAVRWQGDHFPSATYPVCQYDPATDRFVELHGDMRSLELTRGAYTEAAFAEFKASLPKVGA